MSEGLRIQYCIRVVINVQLYYVNLLSNKILEYQLEKHFIHWVSLFNAVVSNVFASELFTRRYSNLIRMMRYSYC